MSEENDRMLWDLLGNAECLCPSPPPEPKSALECVNCSILACVAELERERDEARAQLAEARAEVARLREALAFARSVILSGEYWSPTCEEIIDSRLRLTEAAGDGDGEEPTER